LSDTEVIEAAIVPQTSRSPEANVRRWEHAPSAGSLGENRGGDMRGSNLIGGIRALQILCATSLVGCSDPPSAPPEGNRAPPVIVPAFPGAEGWGATALNRCRNLPLRVHFVQNTNDSGPGSLREALEKDVADNAYDIVVFQTGGAIESRTMININASCIYLAGQSAPGSGVMIRSHATDGHHGHLVRILQQSDVAIRYLTLRHGQEGGRSGGGIVSTGLGQGRDIIFDHLSTSWGGGSSHLQIATSDPIAPDQALRGSIQNSIIAEGFGNIGASFRAATGGPNPGDGESYFGLRQMSFHRNLSAVVGQRHPLVLSGDARVSKEEGTEVVNNLMYGAKNQFTEASDQSVLDFIGNYQDPGPHHDHRSNRWDRATGTLPLNPQMPGSLFVEGNVMVGDDRGEWERWVDRADGLSPLPESFRRSRRLNVPTFPIREMSAAEAREWVLENAGASAGLDCEGRWVRRRDAVDERITGYVRARQGPADAFGSSAQEIHGGWPDMQAGEPCADADGDGLPDAWEVRYFGCATCADAGSQGADGYLLIEHYLNGSHPLSP
jgi:pectate lyase